MSKEAQKRYKKKVESWRVELYPTDEDIKRRLKARIEAGEARTTYVKRLIREDIARRGQWEKTDEFDEQYDYLYRCSVCGRHTVGCSAFCPCCGADMQG